MRAVYFLALALLAQPGVAHEAPTGWPYPLECCSGEDCRETGPNTEPDPIMVPTGWQLVDGTVIAFAEARPSPDGRFHTCRRGGKTTGAVIRPEGRKVCLWVPSFG